MVDLKDLQNGSDIRGVALEGVRNETVNLLPEVTERITFAFLFWLENKTQKKKSSLRIAIGTDSRLSGPDLLKASSSAACKLKCKVFNCGLASTPAMFMSTQFKETQCDGAIMITASHLPYNRNGMKFFSKSGGLDKSDITEILNVAENLKTTKTEAIQKQIEFNLLNLYSQFLCKKIRKETNHNKPLAGNKIIVDAGNGSGGFFANKVLKELGADTTGSQFLEPDGNFPNHIPNPEDKVAIKSLQKAVIKNQVDLGIIFDTDVDRAAIVDSDGNAINRNRLIALISSIVLAEHPSSYIVTDSVTSEGLTTFINTLGGNHLRYKRGYKNVINKAKELNSTGKDCWLAIETSGHAALKENYFLDDGAFLIAKILIAFSKLKAEGASIQQILDNLQEPSESEEFRIIIKNKDHNEYGNKVIDKLVGLVSEINDWEIVKENHEGLRVRIRSLNTKGWFLIRMSLHDPVMPVNIESNNKGGNRIIAKQLRIILSNFTDLELGSLY